MGGGKGVDAGGTMCVSRDPGLDGEMHGAMSDVYRQHFEVIAALQTCSVNYLSHSSCAEYVVEDVVEEVR